MLKLEAILTSRVPIMLTWELTKLTQITKGRTRGEKSLYLEQLLAFINIQQLDSMMHRLTTWQESTKHPRGAQGIERANLPPSIEACLSRSLIGHAPVSTHRVRST